MKKLILFVLAFVLMFFINSVSARTVEFKWNKAEGDCVLGYKIYQSNKSGVYVIGSPIKDIKATDVDGSTITSSIEIDEAGTYYWVLTSYNEVGESAFSEEVSLIANCIDPPQPPKGFLAFWQKLVSFFSRVFN